MRKGGAKRLAQADTIHGSSVNRREGTTYQRAFKFICRNRNDCGFLQILDTVQRGLDFSKLDAVPAALDLGVGSSGKIHEDISSGLPLMPGLVVSLRSVRAMQKPAPRLFFIPPISRAQSDASDVQLADCVLGNGPKGFVEDQQRFTVAGPPDRNGVVLFRHRWDRVVGACNRGLGRSVQI